MPVLDTSGLTKLYGRRVGVTGLDLTIEEGTLCGFLGPNGSGKSTTIRMLLGFLRPTSGHAEIFGLDCWRRGPTIRADVGYVPGDLRLWSWLTPRSALALFGEIHRRDIGPLGREIAEDFELDLDLRVDSMSRGTRQKLGLLLALAHDPRLLVLDEPTSGLDPILQERLKRRLRDLAARGHTVFFSSHTLAEVESLCDRVIILRAGERVADTTIEELRSRARRQVVIRWRDDPPPEDPGSLPPGLEVTSRQAGTWRCRLAGPVDGLVRWLDGHPLDDLVIAPPDIEAIFHEYYEG